MLKHPAVIALLVVLALYVSWTQAGVVAPVPESLPWVGKVEGEFMGHTRANIRAFNGMRGWLADGYAKVTHGVRRAILTC